MSCRQAAGKLLAAFLGTAPNNLLLSLPRPPVLRSQHGRGRNEKYAAAAAKDHCVIPRFPATHHQETPAFSYFPQLARFFSYPCRIHFSNFLPRFQITILFPRARGISSA